MNVPAALADQVPALFDDEAAPLNAAAATAGRGGRPNVRTVHFRYLRSLDTIAFGCHVRSPKWKELRANPRVSCCWFHPRRQVQLRWDARVEQRREPGDPAVAELWERTAEWLRDEYRRGCEGPGVPESFGVAVLRVLRWELYTIDLEQPARSARVSFALNDGGIWIEEPKEILK